MARLRFDRDEVAAMPSSPGVYLFLDAEGRPVYVGKAVSLRARVRSYFGGGDQRLVSRLLATAAASMDFIVTGSEKEALILENSLIKKHAPRFNVRLRDDKTYFSLRLDLEQEWPRLTIVRRRRKDGALYFGPYPSALACRRTIQYLGGIFPLRTCADSVLYNRTRPCIAYEIGHCVAPCVGLADQEGYRRLVDRMIRFLRGQDREVLAELEAEMKEAAVRLEFERAAELRDRLRHIRTTLESPQVARRGGVDRDVIGIDEGEDEVHACVLHVRDGSLAASATFSFKRYAELEALLAGLIGQLYVGERTPPAEILVPSVPEDQALLEEVLAERRGGPVTIRVPQRGEGLRLVHLAEENARHARRREREGEDRTAATLAALQRRLGLVHLPERIECYDVSHLAGEQVVASGVAFRGGRPDKDRYRRYRLRTVQRNDDFAAMEEVLERRLERGRAEADLPDLIVIDGGPPQLARVLNVVRALGVDAVDVVALAKARRSRSRGEEVVRQERVYVPGRDLPVVLDQHAPDALLLQRVRDEAHRFALAYNRKLRAKENITSVLELVPGVGRRRARLLLAHFGSLAAVKAAPPEALAGVSGIGTERAEAIRRYFHEHARPAGEA